MRPYTPFPACTDAKHYGWCEGLTEPETWGLKRERQGWVDLHQIITPSVLLLHSLPCFLVGRQWARVVLHTSPNTTTTLPSSPAMPDQQEKVVFFPLHGGVGKWRPKEGQVCPVPFSKAGFSGGKLKSQEARRPTSSPSPKLLNETSFQKT